MRAPLPAREPERLQALRDYAVLDTPPELAYDDLAFLAAEVCGTPTALVTFVDDRREWYKARWGMVARELDRDVSFCAHAILQRDVMVVPDTTADPRFALSPTVTGGLKIRFYAGMPLVNAEDFALGTIAVVDYVPRELTAFQVKSLRALGRQAMIHLELRRQLVRQQDRHRTVLDASLDAIVLMDASGAVLEFNPAAERMFGYAREEVVGREMATLLIPPAYWEAHRKELERHLTTRHIALIGRRVEITVCRRDGTEFPVELFVQRIDAGATPQFVGFVRDITERVKDQSERRAAPKRYLNQREAAIALNQLASLHRGDFERLIETITEVAARTLDVARVSVWRFSTDRDTLRCACLYELKADSNTRGMELRAEAYPAFCQALTEAYVIAVNDTAEDPRTSELYTGYLASVGVTSLLCASIRVADGIDGVICHEHVGSPRQWTADEESFAVAIASMCSLALEAAECRQANVALLKLHQRVEDIINTVDGVVWECNAQTLEFSFVSQQAKRMLGYPIWRWTEEPTFWRDHIHPEDRESAIAHRHQASTTMESHEFEYRMIAHDGREVWLKDFVTVVQSEGRATELRGIMVDVTGQRQLEDQLRQSQRLEAVGQLAGGIAHDFNNILTVIQGYTALLSLEDRSIENVDEAVEQIGKAAERAARLTRQLLAFSRKQVLRLSGLDLNKIVDNMSRMLRRTLGEHIDLLVEAAAALPPVRADAGMMEQVLLNLVLNARDAMPDGGSLTIRTSVVDIDAGFVRVHSDATPGRYVCLEITDSGPGIAAKALPHVFEPFFTTKEVHRGTGLGLATVYGIVRQHRGWITVESKLGEGTTFRIYLPIGNPAPEPEGHKAPAPAARGRHETVLVVEDEEPVRTLARRVLENAGFTVLEAADGHAALAQWRANQEEIALVLTDMVMPGDMSGLVLATTLHRERPQLAIIITSGYSGDVFGHELEERDGLSFLQKPYQKDVLVGAVRERLDARPAVGA